MTNNSTWFRSTSAFFATLAFCTIAAPAFGEESESGNEQKALEIGNVAAALMDAENYGDACPKLEKARSLAPNSVGIHLLLGECYERSNKFQSACEAFGRGEALAKWKKDSREHDARKSCESIEHLIPRVLLIVPKTLKNLDHWTITLDGLPYYVNLDKFTKTHQAELKMDSGPHYVTILFDGRLAWGKYFAIENNEVRSFAISNRPIFQQMPGRYEAGAWFLAIPSGIAVVGGCAATGMSFSSRDKWSGDIAFGAGLGLIGVGAAGLVGYVMLRSANDEFERSAYKGSSAKSPPPQLQFGIAPNGANLKVTF